MKYRTHYSVIIVILIMAVACMWYLTEEHLAREAHSQRQIEELQKRLFTEAKTEIKIEEVRDEAPIGIANNNPCNVKNKGWQGQIGSDDFGHAIFSHYSYGLRAAAITLKNYQKKYGLKTIRNIIHRYCESNRHQYTQFLSKKLNIGVDEEFDVMSVMPELLKAIVKFETGRQPYPDHVFALAGIYHDAP